MTALNKSWCTEKPDLAEPQLLQTLAPNGETGPQTLFLVKGWNRSVCAVAVLYATFMCKELAEASTARTTPVAMQALPAEVRKPCPQSWLWRANIERGPLG